MSKLVSASCRVVNSPVTHVCGLSFHTSNSQLPLKLSFPLSLCIPSSHFLAWDEKKKRSLRKQGGRSSCILKYVSGYDVISKYMDTEFDKYTEGSQCLKPLVQILTFCFRLKFFSNLSTKNERKHELQNLVLTAALMIAVFKLTWTL